MIQHIFLAKDSFKHKLDGMPCECIPDFEQDQNGNILVIHQAYDGNDNIGDDDEREFSSPKK